MDVLDTLVDAATALGDGLYSVGEDLVLGAERTAEGYGMRGSERMIEIGTENEYLLQNLYGAITNGTDLARSPLGELIKRILIRYYSYLPEDVLRDLAVKAGAVGGGYVTGRMIIGTALARRVAAKLLVKIAESAAFKALAKRLGLSVGTAATGIGIPVALLMGQGVAQRASAASQRLRQNYPELYAELRRTDGLDMLFFLVEKPMEKHLLAISAGKRNLRSLEAAARRQMNK